MRGQVGVEYLIIAGVFALLVGLLVDYYGRVSSRTGTQMVLQTSLDDFKRKADKAYLLGTPAVEVFGVIIPETVVANRTFLGNNSVQISYYDDYGRITDVVRFFDFNVSGYFPSAPGRYELVVYSLGSSGVGVNSS